MSRTKKPTPAVATPAVATPAVATPVAQDARNAQPTTGREGDAPSASADNAKQSPIGAIGAIVDQLLNDKREDRVPENDENVATFKTLLKDVVSHDQRTYGKWPLVGEACRVAYVTREALYKHESIVKGMIIEGLPEAKQAVLAYAKKDVPEDKKELRIEAQKDVSRYWSYVVRYGFPEAPKAEAPKAEAPKAEAPAEKSIAEKLVDILTGAIGMIKNATDPGANMLEALKHLESALLEAKK